MVDGGGGLGGIDPIDGAVQGKALTWGEVPQQLIFLAEKEGNLFSKRLFPFPRKMAQNRGGAVAGLEQA